MGKKLQDVLAANVRAEIAARGLTRAELADLSGVSKSTIQGVALGYQNCSVEVIEKLAKVFKIEPYLLLKRRR